MLDDKTLKKLDIAILMMDSISKIRDPYYHGHGRRVSMNCLKLANELRKTVDYIDAVTDDFLEYLKYAAILHDIGKITIPEPVLNKTTRLSKLDKTSIMLHSSHGADIIASLGLVDKTVENIIRFHHENWDGTGYPDKVKETDIPLGSRIMRVVDELDAMTNVRPYRKVYSITQAFKVMNREVGIRFDPLIYSVFYKMMDA